MVYIKDGHLKIPPQDNSGCCLELLLDNYNCFPGTKDMQASILHAIQLLGTMVMSAVENPSRDTEFLPSERKYPHLPYDSTHQTTSNPFVWGCMGVFARRGLASCEENQSKPGTLVQH